MNNFLKAVDLTKSYRSKKVVDGVSIEFKSGEVVGLLGPNGAGKTTVFSMLIGFVVPERGRVFFNGDDITNLPAYMRARKGIGFLPQEPSVFRKMTVRENIQAVVELKHSGSSGEDIVEALLDEFGLENLASVVAVNLSGGERRRLEIARAIAANPACLLLDEPFTGIDPKIVSELQDLIRKLKQRGLGILLTDHSVREALAVTDRAYIIDSGKIIMTGNPDEIISSSEVRKSYLGEEFRL